MTKRINKLFSYIFFPFFLIILLVISTYSFLVYQPHKAIKILDKAVIYNYSINIKSISSNKNLLKPFYIIEQFQVNNDNKNELIFIPNLKIGLNLIDSLINEYISLSILEIDSLKSSQGQSNKTFEPFLIKGNRLKISNKTFDISAKDFEFVISLNNTKIVLLHGNVNSYPFENINALIDLNENKMFYESNHILNSKQLNQIDTLNLSSLNAHDISLNFSSKGYVDFKTNKNLRFDRLVFQNSSITMNSKFLIENINSTIFSNLNNELLGVFESTLPDQNISGSIFYDYNQSVIRTNLKIIMDVINEIPEEIVRKRIQIAPLMNGYEGMKNIFGIYQQCKIILANRFHSNLCSIGLGVPTIGLVNYPQISNLYKELELTDNTIDLNNDFFVDKLNSKIEYISLNHKRIKANSKNTATRLKKHHGERMNDVFEWINTKFEGLFDYN